MTDTTETTTTASPTAFCQNCGKPLTALTTRTVGPATYCEPCLDARLHGVPGAQPGTQSSPQSGPQSGPQPGARPPYPGTPLYPRTPSVPNPGTAALLGLIPGVGAMYNEQYAKGIVHLIVFAVLILLADVNGIFGLFIAGWVCYMIIEAHHTARARRDGTPLPNPFGLNDIGERLGFGKAWPTGTPNVASVFHDVAHAAHDAATAAQQAAHQFQQHAHYQQQPGYQQQPNYQAQQPWPPTQPPPTPEPTPMPNQSEPIPHTTHFGDWGAQASTGHQYTQNPTAGTQQPWRDTYASAAQPMPPIVMPTITGHQRFPAGAIWLIGAGIFFLLATTGIFRAFRGEFVVGVGLIALAVWLFLRGMLNSGPSLTADGSPAYTLRALRALRGAAWVALTGLLILLDTTNILHWSRSWPLYIILAGVMGFLQRAAQQNAALYPPSQGPII